MARRKRDDEGRFRSTGATGPVRDHPLTSAAVLAGVAAAGAFLWSRRDQISEAVNTGMDRLSEIKAERMRANRSQEEIAEEALTLKETGEMSKGPRGPLAQQDVKAGIATVS